MSPVPNSDDHYDAGSPLDGGAPPSDLGNSGVHYQPTGLEIGVITGVCGLVLLTVVGVFVWRARKNRFAKGASALHSGPDTVHSGGSPQPFGSHSAIEPVPPPKDSRFGAVKNEEPASFDQPIPLPPNRNEEIQWSHWTPIRREGNSGHVEEHEIASRF
ncbi:hypothetical protein GL218_02411 [Daldinia childiae]|uniref:uncharacterized protein n=1 Tax=Daldinia childiae TaxID=326645 RepID=UPI0014489D74|nr:uncharacterized protein GL218_02411 [Daldinia childiae]KAF3064421.1 hypothetical protein GL218_02411 [Daldinia childiae]